MSDTVLNTVLDTVSRLAAHGANGVWQGRLGRHPALAQIYVGFELPLAVEVGTLRLAERGVPFVDHRVATVLVDEREVHAEAKARDVFEF